MTIDELINELTTIKERNREPEVPNFDPGTIQVYVQDENGIFDSPINTVEMANDVWLIVNTPEL